MTMLKKLIPTLGLALVTSFLLPLSGANATIANVYSCTAGDTNGGGTLSTCTHTALTTSLATVATTGSAGSGATNGPTGTELCPNSSYVISPATPQSPQAGWQLYSSTGVSLVGASYGTTAYVGAIYAQNGTYLSTYGSGNFYGLIFYGYNGTTHPTGSPTSGNTCTLTVVTTYAATLVTTAPTSVITTYTCTAGYTLSGTNCSSNSGLVPYSATTSYSCNSGGTVVTSYVTISGKACSYPSSSISAVANSVTTCPSGGTLSGSSCVTGGFVANPSVTNSYSCPSGGSLSGGNCISQPASYSPTSTTTYSCPNGGVLTGSSCVTSSSSYLPTSTTTWVCSNGSTPIFNGVSSSGGFGCSQTGATYSSTTGCGVNISLGSPYITGGITYYPCQYLPTTAPAQSSVAVTCPQGGTLSGSICYVQSSSQGAFKTYVYSCPSGGSYFNNLCVFSGTSYLAVNAPTYSCPTGQVLIFNGVSSTNGYGCNSNTSYSATTSTVYTCPTGATVSGTACITSGYTDVALTTRVCNSGDTLVGAQCFPPSTSVAATPFYVGSCIVNFQLNNSTGACNLITTGFTNPIGQYLCTTSVNLLLGSYQFTSNTDVSGADGNGNYNSCQLVNYSGVNLNTGYFLCTSIDYNTGVSLAYASLTDLTGTSSNAYIFCTYSGDSPYNDTIINPPTYTPPSSTEIDPCTASTSDFQVYLTCIYGLS